MIIINYNYCGLQASFYLEVISTCFDVFYFIFGFNFKFAHKLRRRQSHMITNKKIKT